MTFSIEPTMLDFVRSITDGYGLPAELSLMVMAAGCVTEYCPTAESVINRDAILPRAHALRVFLVIFFIVIFLINSSGSGTLNA